MAQRTRVTGTRSIALWLLISIMAVLVAGLIAGVLIVYPGYQRQQQLEAHYNACVAFHVAGDWDKAVDECAQVVALNAGYKDVQTRYAEAIAKQQEARAMVRATATAQAQAELEAHYQKGLAYARLERWEEAKAELDQVVSQDPTYKDVQARLAEVELAIGSRPTATLSPPPTATATPRPKVVLEVAAGKPATASGFWRYSDSHSYPPSNVVDRRTDEPVGCGPGSTSYWLLPDRQTGWVQIDLQQGYTIVKLRWLNTHNGRCGNDRATTGFHIAVSQTGTFKGEEQTVYSGTMAFLVSPTYQKAVLSPPAVARYVRFYVDEYHNWGGGLNELEVYAEVPAP